MRLGLICKAVKYAYHTQVHCNTGATTSSLVLPRQPPGPTTFVPLTVLPTEAKAETLPKDLLLRLLFRIAEMRNKAEKRLKAVLKQYKPHHEAKGRE